MQINIISVGLGNISSIKNWLYSCNHTFKELKNPEDWKDGPIIIPGVSMSDNLIIKLKKKNFNYLFELLKKKGVGILAICSGFQSLSNFSYEGSSSKGLNYFPGNTVQLPNKSKYRVGWEKLRINISIGKSQIQINKKFFYNHGYAIKINKSKLNYFDKYSLIENNFLSFAQHRTFLGTQFHPEKSRNNGNFLLRYLVAI